MIESGYILSIGVLTGVLLIFLGGLLITLLVILIKVWERITLLAGVPEKLEVLDGGLAAMMDGAGNHMPPMMARATYFTKDGKYKANSLEELVDKMVKGGDLNLDPAEDAKIRNFFNNVTEAIPDIDIPDWDDDDDDEFGWGEKKEPWQS